MNENVLQKNACKCLAVAVIKKAIHDGDVEWFTNPKSAFSFYLELSGNCIKKSDAIRLAEVRAERRKRLGVKSKFY